MEHIREAAVELLASTRERHAEERAAAESRLGRAITPQEWNAAYPKAADKLHRIIQREGDNDGERREPWYIGMLVAEQIHAAEATAHIETVFEMFQNILNTMPQPTT